MSKLNVHPAPNRLGQMMPGWLVVPFNPVEKGRVEYRPTIGEFIGARLVTPYNPIQDRLASPNILRPVASSGGVNVNVGGCGCKECGEGGLSGLGNMGLNELFGTVNPGYIVAAIVAAYLIFRRK